MKMDEHAKTALGQAIAFSVPGLITGILLLAIPAGLLLNLIFVILGIVTVVYSVPGLVAGITSFATTEGKVSLVLSAIATLVGLMMIFHHNSVLMIVLGIYLLVLPFVTIVMAKDHMMQFKGEMPKMILGVILIILGPANALDLVMRIMGWVIIALTVVYAVSTFLTLRKHQHKTGARIFADTNGDGTIDTVYVDTTGDGKADAAMRYRESK